MADFDLGGAFLGPIEQSQRIEQQKQLGPAQIAHLQALSQQETAQARKTSFDLSAEENLAALMRARGAPKPGEAQSETLARLSSLAAEAGSPTMAGNLGMRSAQAATAEASKAAHATAQAKAQFEIDTKHQQLFDGLMADVTDERGWKAANLAYQMQTGEESKFASMPYNPQLIRMLRDEGVKQIDRKRLALEGAKLAERQTHDRAMEKNAKTKTDAYVKGVESLIEAREARAKEGGKDTKAPSTAETGAALNLLENQMKEWFKDTPPEGQMTAAQTLASRAKALMSGPRKIAGLSYDQALARSMVSMQKENEFLKHGGFQPLGEDSGSAIRLTAPPKSLDDLIEGKWYTFGGRTGQYVGGKFLVRAARMPAPPADESEEEDEEE